MDEAKLPVHIVDENGTVVEEVEVLDPRAEYCRLRNELLEGSGRRAVVPAE